MKVQVHRVSGFFILNIYSLNFFVYLLKLKKYKNGKPTRDGGNDSRTISS
jgi:hypothetical protein